ncbi:hypothetical protein BDQ17DRAFT_1429249 [Cyathus striatus]|nr:hypothetical protein BDQ17DRAFT_1429249 [Cyathus striatus]
MSTLWTTHPDSAKALFHPIANCMQEIHNHLMNSGTYLSDKDFQANVTWGQIATSSKDISLETACNAVKGKASINDLSKNAHEPGDTTEVAEESTEHDVALTSAVVKISDEDFYFTSDGSFTGTNKFTHNFYDLTLSLSGGAPPMEPFRSDYPQTIQNVKWLLSLASTKWFSGQCGFCVGLSDQPRLKLLLDDAPDPEPTDLNNFSNIHNWPVSTDTAKEAIPDLYNTHCVVRPPTYDMHGNIINPNFFHSWLVNATVELVFVLSHWSIQASCKEEPSYDTFAADLVAIQTITHPPRYTVTAHEKCVAERLDPLTPFPAVKKHCTKH